MLFRSVVHRLAGIETIKGDSRQKIRHTPCPNRGPPSHGQHSPRIELRRVPIQEGKKETGTNKLLQALPNRGLPGARSGKDRTDLTPQGIVGIGRRIEEGPGDMLVEQGTVLLAAPLDTDLPGPTLPLPAIGQKPGAALAQRRVADGKRLDIVGTNCVQPEYNNRRSRTYFELLRQKNPLSAIRIKHNHRP